MKLTAATVSALKLPPGKRDDIRFDDDLPGFGVRLRDGGSKTYVFQYKAGAKQRRMALGAVTAVNFGQARKTAERLYARTKLGQDPAGDKAEARVRAAETFEAAAVRYLDQQRERLRPRSYPDLERHLMKHAKTLHGLQLAKITRRDIATVIGAAAKNSGSVTGNRVRASLSSLFTSAMQWGLVDANPVIGTARNPEHTRDRVLTSDELRAIWNALPDDQFGDIMRLLALTGQRAGEIAGLRWSEIRDGMITLPGERTKNHRPHVVPLSEPAGAIISKQRQHEERDLIFGAGTGPFSGWSKSRERLNARIKETTGEALPHWTPHDLRRTAATGMAEIGVQPHVIEATLNHVSGTISGVAKVYNRNSYEREKQMALASWGEHLMAIIEGRKSKVTPLRREA